MPRMPARSLIILLAWTGLFSSGCGEGPIPADDPRNLPLHAVTGKVIIGGDEEKPLEGGGEIQFMPDANSRYVATSPIAADGTFRLTTELKGKGKMDGAPEGEYSVAVKPAVSLYPTRSVLAGQKYTVAKGENSFTVLLPDPKIRQPPGGKRDFSKKP